MKKRFTDEQIIQVLKEHAAGDKVAEISRKHRASALPASSNATETRSRGSQTVSLSSQARRS